MTSARTKIHLVSDFDLTITKVHSGGEYRTYTKEELIEPDRHVAIIRTLQKRGHFYSIATFGDSPEMVRETLKVMGLEDHEIEKIHIAAGNNKEKSKSRHITDAKAFHKIDGQFTSKTVLTVLMDDHIKPVTQAVRDVDMGIHVFHMFHREAEHRYIFDREFLSVVERAIKTPSRAVQTIKAHASRSRYAYRLYWETPQEPSPSQTRD